jgi:hypothetical protein
LIETVRHRLGSTLAAALIAALVLYWLLKDGTGEAVLNALRGATLWPLLLAGCLVAVIQGLRAWRFRILADGGLAPPEPAMFGIATKLVLLNYLLPFKLGELSFPVMMKRRYGTPLLRGAGILILSRFLDFGAVGAILLLTGAMILDPSVLAWSRPALIALGLALLALPFLGLDLLPWLQRLVAPWPRLARLVEQLTAGASLMRPLPQRSLAALLTLGVWAAHSLIAWLAGLAIHAAVGPVQLAMAGAAGNLAFALPVPAIAGLGAPQAAWVGALRLADIPWYPAIASAIVCHGLLLIAVLVLGLVTLLVPLARPGGEGLERRGDRDPART